MTHRFFLLIIAILSVVAPAAQAGDTMPLRLVEAGQPQATIVLPADAAEPLQVAAADLQHYVQRITGVRLPISTTRPEHGTALRLGTFADLGLTPPHGSEVKPDTYTLQTAPDELRLTGPWPTTAAFAVYAFLEEDLGVRWFAPGDLWEEVPSAPNDLTVTVGSRTVQPPISPRIWSGHHWTEAWESWNRRNKNIPVEVTTRRQFQNNLFRVFPPSQFGQSNPEYFPLIRGRRWIPESDDYRYWLPCTSNPEVIAHIVATARKFFDEHPLVDSFSLGQDDIVQMCGCADCRALDASPEDYDRREFSDRYYKFINAVARELQTSHPDRFVGALIYSIARTPPREVPQMEPNVFGFLTENVFSWWQPGQREHDQAITRDWAQRVSHLGRYDYFGLGSMAPRYAPRLMAEQIRFDQELGFDAMYTEVYTFLPHTAPMIWALSKLQWEPQHDLDALLGEFFTRLYGEAAPQVAAYFEHLEETWMTRRPGRATHWEHAHEGLIAQLHGMSPDDVHRGLALLEAALQSASDPRVRARITIHRDALQYAAYGILSFDLYRQIQEIVVTDRASADQVLQLAWDMTRYLQEGERFWQVTAERQDLLGDTVRGLGRLRSRNQDVRAIAQSIVGNVLAASRWHADHAPAELAVWRERFDAQTGILHDLMSRDAWQALDSTRSLLTNGDFEEGPTRTAAPPQADLPYDWQQQGLPAGWSYWSRFAGITPAYQAEGGVDGSAGMVLKAHGDQVRSDPGIHNDLGILIQQVEAVPGQWYLATADIQMTPSFEHAFPHLQLRFQNARGQQTNHLARLLAHRPGWHTVAVLAQAPKDATTLRIMPTASGIRDGQVHFDRITLTPLSAELREATP